MKNKDDRPEQAADLLRHAAEIILATSHTGAWDLDLLDHTAHRTLIHDQIFGYETLLPGWTYEMFLEHVLPEDRPEVDRSFRQATAALADLNFECRIRRVDGEVRWIWVMGSYERNPEGHAVRMLGLVQDITARKQAEEALREGEEQHQTILQTAMDGFWLVDAQGYLREVNEAYCRMSGYSSQELRTMRIPDLEDLEAADDTAAHIGKVIAQGEDRFESRHRRKDGSIFDVEVSVQYRPADGGQFVAFLRDITERKRAEVEKAKLEGQLRQAQKMESVGRLAGGVAHDFNNMLGVILGHAEMALGQVDPAHPLHADLEAIRKAAVRSADLTRQLLAFARKQNIQPKVLDLNQTVVGMLKMLERLIGENIRLNWQPGVDLWPVKVDPSQIDQMMSNLCVNARDAIANVGRITVGTRNSILDEDYCASHVGSVPGEYVMLAVSDDGCGMGQETLAQVFDPFFTTKGLGKGTGLGLATVYGAVKQNHGFIAVSSEPGQGTTFTIYLPRHVGKTGQACTEGAAGPAKAGQETILLVEDEPAILEMTTMMLEGQGYTVLAAITPGEAIRLARENACQIHLLMTDVVMPEMNGLDLAENLRALYPKLKILFMSGHTADIIAHHGVLEEGVYFVQKPFSIHNLSSKVREALESMQPRNQSIQTEIPKEKP